MEDRSKKEQELIAEVNRLLEDDLTPAQAYSLGGVAAMVLDEPLMPVALGLKLLRQAAKVDDVFVAKEMVSDIARNFGLPRRYD